MIKELVKLPSCESLTDFLLTVSSLISNLRITDLHPGNVLYHEFSTDGTDISVPYAYTSDSSNKWRLSFIDAGLVSTLDKQDRKNFVELFSAVVVNNGKRVGELMVDRSRDEGAKCIDREKFCLEIGELVNSVHVSGEIRAQLRHHLPDDRLQNLFLHSPCFFACRPFTWENWHRLLAAKSPSALLHTSSKAGAEICVRYGCSGCGRGPGQASRS